MKSRGSRGAGCRKSADRRIRQAKVTYGLALSAIERRKESAKTEGD